MPQEAGNFAIAGFPIADGLARDGTRSIKTKLDLGTGNLTQKHETANDEEVVKYDEMRLDERSLENDVALLVQGQDAVLHKVVDRVRGMLVDLSRLPGLLDLVLHLPDHAKLGLEFCLILGFFRLVLLDLLVGPTALGLDLEHVCRDSFDG